MDGSSEHPLTNKAATAEFLRIQNLINALSAQKGTTTTSGFVQLSTANSITDPNAYALSASENNASIEGSLANHVKYLEDFKSDLTPVHYTDELSSLPDNGRPRTFIQSIVSHEIDPALYSDGQYFIVLYIIAEWAPYSREIQLAFPVFWVEPCMYLRKRHDGVWTGWAKFSGTMI